MSDKHLRRLCWGMCSFLHIGAGSLHWAYVVSSSVSIPSR